MQGSSRGGRDNKPSTSMFFYNSKNISSSTSSISNISFSTSNTTYAHLLEQDKALVNKYLLETTCRRRQISLYLDNKLITSCSSLESPCDLCIDRTSTINSQIDRILEGSKAVELERTKIRNQISSLASKCLFCSILRPSSNNVDHLTSSCSIFSNIELLAKEVKRLIYKKEVVLKENSCCFTCLLPTIICSHLKEENQCFNSKFIYRVLALLYNQQKELELEAKYSLKSNPSLLEFLKKALSKVFVKELDTEAILGVYTFIYNS